MFCFYKITVSALMKLDMAQQRSLFFIITIIISVVGKSTYSVKLETRLVVTLSNVIMFSNSGYITKMSPLVHVLYVGISHINLNVVVILYKSDV